MNDVFVEHDSGQYFGIFYSTTGDLREKRKKDLVLTSESSIVPPGICEKHEKKDLVLTSEWRGVAGHWLHAYQHTSSTMVQKCVNSDLGYALELSKVLRCTVVNLTMFTKTWSDMRKFGPSVNSTSFWGFFCLHELPLFALNCFCTLFFINNSNRFILMNLFKSTSYQPPSLHTTSTIDFHWRTKTKNNLFYLKPCLIQEKFSKSLEKCAINCNTRTLLVHTCRYKSFYWSLRSNCSFTSWNPTMQYIFAGNIKDQGIQDCNIYIGRKYTRPRISDKINDPRKIE